MSYFQAKRFNKKAQKEKYKSEEVINRLDVKEGDKVADIGSGGGYFSYKFAEIVGDEGVVYAADTNMSFLEFIEKESEKRNLNNIETIFIENTTFEIEDSDLDIIFMRNVTHHIDNRNEYFKRLKKYLKKDGKFVIIEYQKKNNKSFSSMFGHYVKKETLIDEMKRAGYKLIKEYNFLPEQNFTIYTPIN